MVVCAAQTHRMAIAITGRIDSTPSISETDGALPGELESIAAGRPEYPETASLESAETACLESTETASLENAEVVA